MNDNDDELIAPNVQSTIEQFPNENTQKYYDLLTNAVVSTLNIILYNRYGLNIDQRVKNFSTSYRLRIPNEEILQKLYEDTCFIERKLPTLPFCIYIYVLTPNNLQLLECWRINVQSHNIHEELGISYIRAMNILRGLYLSLHLLPSHLAYLRYRRRNDVDYRLNVQVSLEPNTSVTFTKKVQELKLPAFQFDIASINISCSYINENKQEEKRTSLTNLMIEDYTVKNTIPVDTNEREAISPRQVTHERKNSIYDIDQVETILMKEHEDNISKKHKKIHSELLRPKIQASPIIPEQLQITQEKNNRQYLFSEFVSLFPNEPLSGDESPSNISNHNKFHRNIESPPDLKSDINFFIKKMKKIMKKK
eukprot:TRINITY_DN679_c0_g1_i1.p1 TRINITY_DN679_c0_g1~~TRINITY_DN679_c0_g1_i1.p1  ORF type:complete len:365 (-),score=70.76 TRINITY_DN679_c0_g1_i1:17-1111(-)